MALMNGLITVFIIFYLIVVYGNDDGKDTKKKDDEHKPHWGYTAEHGDYDPTNWRSVSHYCNNKIYMQSPINIETSKLMHNDIVCDPLKELDEHFVNGHDNGIINGIAKNNGHSLVITPVEFISDKNGYIKLNKERNCIMELSNFWNYNMNIGDNKYYCFDSFHFHWARVNNGKGSEHTINGKQYPLEAHFVHYSCDFSNIGEALSNWRLGGNIGVGPNKKDIFVLGVVGVFFEIGAPNPTLDKIFEKYTKLKKVNAIELIKGININDIMPKNKGYYVYEGSLTTPPCYPVVKWHIMKDVLSVSQEQMNKLQQLMNPNNEPEGDNFRPIETNPNPVYDCTQHTF